MEDEMAVVENANRIEVTVTGAGRLAGLDNGDSTTLISTRAQAAGCSTAG